MTAKKFNYQELWKRIEREANPRFINALSRRDFVKLFAASMAAAALARTGVKPARAASSVRRAPARQVVAPSLPNGIAAGDVTQTSAMLWTRSTEPGAVTFEYSTSEDFADIAGTLTAEATEALLPVKVMAEGLTPNTTYYYRVTDAAGASLMGRFRTSAEAGTRTGLRFGVSGDWRGELRPYPAVSNAAARDLEFFLLHGDTVYADIPSIDLTAEQAVTLDEFRIKHGEVYSARFDVNHWADIRSSAWIMATIDDHEVTNDFAGGAAPSTDERFADDPAEYINQTALYRNGLQAFQEYNPLRDEFYDGTGDVRVDGRPKLYRYYTFGDTAAVYVLDARSFRDANVEGTQDIFNPDALQAFYEAMFTEGRTMLGRPQVEDLKRDLLAAHEAGITWKFVMIPEPIQLMGWFGGNDRWEGFAPERTEVLQFIADNGIQNVVWVSADVHSTFVNEVTYQTEPGGDEIDTGSWEITTGSVAFFPPTGAALVAGANEFGLFDDEDFAEYQQMSLEAQDEELEGLFNRFVLGLQGYDRIGLDDELATLVSGAYILGHSFGWTEFDIDAETQVLTVTTYGVRAYSPEALEADPDEVLSREPQILSQFTVNPRL